MDCNTLCTLDLPDKKVETQIFLEQRPEGERIPPPLSPAVFSSDAMKMRQLIDIRHDRDSMQTNAMLDFPSLPLAPSGC
jgi:hypothetical protein